MPRAPRQTRPTIANAPSPPPAAPPEGLPYGELSQRHADYDGDYWQEIEDFYVGGRQLERNIQKYLPPLLNEGVRYQERLKCAGYVNHFGHIIGKIAAAVCAEPLTVRPAADADNPATPGEPPKDDVYAQFQANVDGAGTALATMLHEQLEKALKVKTAFLAIDFPRRPEGVEVGSLADENALGLGRPYAVNIPRDQVIEWDEDDDGGFRYLVIHRVKTRKAPPGKRTGTIVEEFKVWEKLESGEPEDAQLDFEPDGEDVDDNARAIWSLYRIEYDPKKQKLKDDTIVPLVDRGATSFRRIPVLPLTLKDGLWAGNKIVGLAKEHWQRRTSLVSAENKSLVTIPVMALGPEMSGVGQAIPARVQQNANRGTNETLANLSLNGTVDSNGFMRIGRGDEVYYAEPVGGAYGLVSEQLDGLREELHRVVDQMSSSAPAGAQATQKLQSGASKMMDRSAEGIVYTALGHAVREYGLLIHKTISEARKEKVIWNAHGMDSYEAVDRDALVAEAQGMLLLNIPSVTFKRIYATQLALALVENADVQTKEAIRQEIAEGTFAEESMNLELGDETHTANVESAKAKAAEAKRAQTGQPAAGGPPRGAPNAGRGGQPGPGKRGPGQQRQPGGARAGGGPRGGAPPGKGPRPQARRA